MIKKLIQMKCPVPFFGILACAATLLAGCNLQSYNSPEGYDLENGAVSELGKVLNEISGITYNDNDSSLLAISDSKKKVFEIHLKRLKLRDYTGDVVGPDQDLEDLVDIANSVYLLSSKGTIYEVRSGMNDTAGVRTYNFWSTEKNDFETLYHDPSANGLILLCKSCASDKGKQMRSAYRFDLTTKQFDTTAFYTISTTEVKELAKDSDAKFDPSAASINPVNKRLYILSSAGNLLVIADTQGSPKEVYRLNPDDHPQAEGIAFAPNGTMFISNEGKYGKPTLQVFHFQNGKKK